MALTLKQITRQQYYYHRHHDRSPYTWFKARFYMNSASWVVYKLQNSLITPNMLTIAYGVVGLIGGILLATNRFIWVALLIFFSKGILDWSDGHLVRIQRRSTDFGERLDILCGKIGTISFYLGLSLYFGNFTTYYLVPYVLLSFFIMKKIGVPLSRACVVDGILFIVMLHKLAS